MAELQPGPITVKGIITSTTVDTINIGDITADVLTRDPYSGETIRIPGIDLVQNNPALPDAIGENEPCVVTVTGYDAYRRKDVTQMTVSVEKTKVQGFNSGLPDRVKLKSTMDSFAARPTAICKSFNDKTQEMNERMGMTHKRTDLTMIRGKGAGSSPSLIIHQGNGDIMLSDGSGKGGININNNTGTSVSGGNFDTGSAKVSKSSMAYGGMTGYENPVGDVLPSGTILAPYPKLLPHVTKIMNTILPIMDMIDLGRCCKEAYDLMYKDNEGGDNAKSSQATIEKLENKRTGNKVS